MTEKALNRSRNRYMVIVTLILTLLALFSYRSHFFTWADTYLYDRHFALRGAIPASGKIVLVMMDEKSRADLSKKRDGWSRKEMAQALSHLCEAGAGVIGLDLILSEPDTDPLADEALARAIGFCGNVVLARSLQSSALSPLAPFREAMVGDGFIDVFIDPNHQVLREIPFLNATPLPDGSLEYLPSFSLELARAFLDIEFNLDFSEKKRLLMGDKKGRHLRLPCPDLLINYHGRHDAFQSISFSDAVLNRFSPDTVKGKILIVGSALVEEKDFFYTPFTHFMKPQALKGKFEKISHGEMNQDYGVSCHAHAVETIINGRFIRSLNDFGPWGMLLLMGLAGSLGMIFHHPAIPLWISTALLFLSLFITAGLSHLLFLKMRLWVEIAPLLSLLLLQFIIGQAIQKIFETRQKKRITGLFGRYVSSSVVSNLIKGDIKDTLEGKRKELTMLFSDLRGFTTLSEKLGAKETSALLNTYFSTMIPLVFKNQGTLDKLMGDAIMAFFGAPMELADHPSRAAQTAIDMIHALSELKKAPIPGIDRLNVGIGINTGEVTVGNLGSDAFMDYTVIGDAVNLASRLEGLNKIYGTRIIISEFTEKRLAGAFQVRELDIVRVKGKEDAVKLFELMVSSQEKDRETAALIDRFHQGLRCYRKRDWDEAATIFREILSRHPEDGPSALYLERTRAMKAHPPGEAWDGVTVFTSK